MAPEIGSVSLTKDERIRLKATTHLDCIEGIDGVAHLAQTLSVSEEITETIIEGDDVLTARRLAITALRNEFDYIEGLCSSGFVSTADTRLHSEYGPASLLNIIYKVVGAERPDPTEYIASL